MGFFSDLKEDLSQAVNELMPEEELDQAAVEETKEQPVENTQETTEETPMEPQAEETPNDNAALEEMLKNLDSIEIPQEKEEQPEDSLTIKERVNRAVQIQRERYANEKFKFNSQLSGENIKKYCKLNKEEQNLMEKIYTTMDLSIRAYDKIIKVARTIADLKQHEKIQQGDIAEAVSYRPVLFK